MSRFIVTLSDDERAALERVRAAGGYRSHAEAVRALIRHADGKPDQAPLSPQKAAEQIKSGMTIGEYQRRVTPQASSRLNDEGSAVPLAGTFERKPYQKGAKR